MEGSGKRQRATTSNRFLPRLPCPPIPERAREARSRQPIGAHTGRMARTVARPGRSQDQRSYPWLSVVRRLASTE